MLTGKGFLINVMACLMITVMLTGCGSSFAKDVEYKNNMYNDGIVLVENIDDSWSMINEKGEELANYESINYMYGNGLVAVSNGHGFGYNGYINTNGEEVIPLIYSDAKIFTEGLAGVNIKGKYGFVDTKGKLKITPAYYEVGLFSDGLCAVCKHDKWGYIDVEGKVVVDFKYKSANEFINGSAIVETEDEEELYILINKEGEEISETGFEYMEYKTLGSIKAGIIIIEKEYKIGFMDAETGKIVVYPIYDRTDGFYGDTCKVELNNNWGYIDATGEVVVEAKQINEYAMFNTAIKLTNEKYGLVDRHGVLITNPNFKKDILNSDGLIRAITGDKLGYINSAGKLKIETDYDSIQEFSDGMAAVKKDNKWGFIDTRGNEVIVPKYEYSYMFDDGVATIYEDSDCYIIDKKGNEILEKDYYKLGFIMDNKIAMQLEDELVGYMDKTEKIVIEPKYDDAYDFYKGKAVVEIDGKFGYIDEHGKYITDIVYDMIATNRDGKVVAYKEGNWECLDGRDAPNNIYMDYNRYDNIGIKQIFGYDPTYNYQVKKELVGPFDLVYDDELRGYFDADNFFTDDGYMTLIYNYKYGLVNIDRGEVLNIEYRDIKPLFDKNALFTLLKNNNTKYR